MTKTDWLMNEANVELFLCLPWFETKKDLNLNKLCRIIDANYSHCSKIIKKLHEGELIYLYSKDREIDLTLTDKGRIVHDALLKIRELMQK
jgi:predicted transcriptional regulator